MYKSNFINCLVDRGFLHQSTNLEKLDQLCFKRSISGYIGFDCTADSLHIGSLSQIMMLRHFQKAGHKPIILMGGGTTKVGDPSGKDSSRPLLTNSDIISNTLNTCLVNQNLLDMLLSNKTKLNLIQG